MNWVSGCRVWPCVEGFDGNTPFAFMTWRSFFVNETVQSYTVYFKSVQHAFILCRVVSLCVSNAVFMSNFLTKRFLQEESATLAAMKALLEGRAPTVAKGTVQPICDEQVEKPSCDQQLTLLHSMRWKGCTEACKTPMKSDHFRRGNHGHGCDSKKSLLDNRFIGRDKADKALCLGSLGHFHFISVCLRLSVWLNWIELNLNWNNYWIPVSASACPLPMF